MIHLADVRVFLAVVAAGSFSEAARRMKMPKSSVTRQMNRIEAMVGGQLFRRTARTVELTAEGRNFLPHAQRLFDTGVEAQNALRTKAVIASGLLTVSATAPFAQRFLVPYLPDFQARYPQVQLALWLTSGRVEVGSGEGQVDIAIRLRSSAGADLATRKLGEISFCVVAAPSYIATHGIPAEPSELCQHAMIELGPPNKAHQVELRRGREILPIRYQPSLQIDDPESVAIAALAGMGIAVLPSFIVASAVADGRLIRILPDWAPAPIPINLLYRTDITPPVRVRAFADYLAETIGQSQPWAV